MTIAYPYGNGLYLNLTNRCPTACRFCIKRSWDWRYRGWDLKLKVQEPSAKAVWEAVLKHGENLKFKELVFCGYGECTYRLPILIHVAGRARRRFPGLRLRLNTIGLGNLIWGREIAGMLAPVLDAVCVSLNTADPAQWLELHAPLAPYRKQGFASALEFIRGCVRERLETTVTAVDQPGIDLQAVRELSRALGAGFRSRPPLASS